MLNITKSGLIAFSIVVFSLLTACGSGSSDDTSTTDTDSSDDTPSTDTSTDTDCTDPVTELPGAFNYFGSNVSVVLSDDGCTVTLETEGKPDHASPYWDPNSATGLWEEAEEDDWEANSTPGYIDNVAVSHYSVTVPASAEQADETTETTLGAMGIAVSGSPIFNDNEGNGVLTTGVATGLDANGAHTGPEVYHYHLEPTKHISDDDDELIGIIKDGFFLYGRKCPTTSDYPTDLDDTNGHTSYLWHFDEEVYHYHILDEYFLTSYYLLFPGEMRGTPNAFSN